MDQPKVIFLDAVGTLFGVKGSVGEVYSQLAQQFGVETDSTVVNQAFFQSFKAAPTMAFPNHDITQIPGLEYEWWKAIARQTFEAAGVYAQFTDFDAFFDALYAHFSTAEPWFVYRDIPKALHHWREEGIDLGVVSNFDSRIHFALEALGLAPFFTSVTISTEVGAAKPDPRIFQAALDKHGCTPDQAWHIGDSYADDVEGAKQVGIRGIWLNRRQGRVG